MESVRAAYDVPAYRGRRITYLGMGGPLSGHIISSTGSHLYMRTDDGRRFGPLHPCWRIDYHDGLGDRTGRPTPMDLAWANA